MDLDLIEESALKELILSTGKVAEFILVMRDSAIKAHRNESKKITKKEVKEALDKLRETYDRTLNSAHKKMLLEIYKKKEARDVNSSESTFRELLFSLTAVEYDDENDGRWCDINPILLPLVEKWKEEKE